MKVLSRVMTATAVLLFAPVLLAGEFKVYPGAKLDQQATRVVNKSAAQSGMTGTVYTTNDPFQKVTAFYKGIATEYMMPRASGTTGQPKKRGSYELWEAYFIFDGAADLASSRLWIKVQRPALGLYEEDLKSGTVRDLTVIVVSKKG